MLKLDRKWISWFNKNKTKDEYRIVLNEILPDNKKCKCCGDVIYYYDSTFQIKNKNILNPYKKSYLSSKNVLGDIYYLSVCEDCLIKKYPEYNSLNKSRVFNRICDITNFAFSIPDVVSENWKNENYSITLKTLSEKYGDEEGKTRWESYCNKQAVSNTYEYKKEKYGWSETEFKEYNKTRAVTLKNLILKHGEEIGLEKWDSYCERQRYTCTKNYFIEEYGKVEGLFKFDNFVEKRSYNFGYSDISQEIFNKLKDELTNYNIQYATHGSEKKILNESNTVYQLDLYINELNLAVEYNGDLWHGNPEKYNENDIPIKFYNKLRGLTAKEIWEKDKKRINYLKTKYGIDTIIIWESDYKKDGMDVTIKKILKEIEKYE